MFNTVKVENTFAQFIKYVMHLAFFLIEQKRAEYIVHVQLFANFLCKLLRNKGLQPEQQTYFCSHLTTPPPF